MKSLKILLSSFLVFIMFAFTLVGDPVPQKVKEAFAKKFPTAKKVKWERENATEWEAEFKMNEVEYSANFLEDGTWKETEHEIEKKDIPEKVMTAFMKTFPELEIEEAEISVTYDMTFYELKTEKDKTEIEVVFDSNGNLIKEKIEIEDNDNDNDNDELEDDNYGN